MIRVSAVLALLLLGGCLSIDPALVHELAADPATVSLSIQTPYGAIKFCRTALPNGDVTCTADGLSLKSSLAVTVPVTITPQVTVVPAK